MLAGAPVSEDLAASTAIVSTLPQAPIFSAIPDQTATTRMPLVMVDLQPYLADNVESLQISVLRVGNPAVVRSARQDPYLPQFLDIWCVVNTVGSSTVTVRVVNKYGLATDRTFTVSVTEPAPLNRPISNPPGTPDSFDSLESVGAVEVLGGTLTVNGADSLTPGVNLTIGSSGTVTLGTDMDNGSGVTMEASSVTNPALRVTDGGLDGDLLLKNAKVEFVCTSDQDFNYDISDDSGSSLPGAVVKSGTAVLTLAGTNSYTSGTTIIAGMLEFDGSATVPDTGTILIQQAGALAATGPTGFANASEWLDTGSPIATSSSGTLALSGDEDEIDMTGFDDLYLGATSGGVAFSGTLIPADQVYRLGGGAGTITVESDLDDHNNSTTIASIRGNVILSGTNTYTGGTSVDGGMVAFSVSAAVPSTPTNHGILINAGAALKATGAYSYADDWLASGDISHSSAGALVIATSQDVDMTDYEELYLGAVGTVSYSDDLTPADDTYRLGGGPGTLTVECDLDNIGSTTMKVSVAGNVTLTPDNENDFSGSTTVVSGTLKVGNSDALSDTSGVTIESGGTLDLNGLALGKSVTISGEGVDGIGAIINSYATAASINSLTLGADATVGGNWSVTGTNATVTGSSHDLTKAGDGSVTFDNCGTTNLGDILVSAGMLIFQGSSAMNGSDYTATVSPEAGLVFRDNTASSNNNNKKISLPGGTLQVDGTTSTPTLLGQVTVGLNSAIQVDTGNTLTLSGKVTGGALTKTGSGTLKLNASTNDYTGKTLINEGPLLVGISGAIPHGEGKGDVTVDGTLDLGGIDLTINGLWGSGTITNNRATTGGNILTVGDNDRGGTFSGTLANGANGTLALKKIGSSTLTLSAGSSFTGGTTGEDGTLSVSNSTALGTGTVTLSGSQLQIAGSVTLGNPIALAVDTTVEVTGTYTASLTGVISNTGGTHSLEKTGSGTLIVTGNNTYGGGTAGTTIAEGTLSAGSDGNLGGGPLALDNARLRITGTTAFASSKDVSLTGNSVIEVTNTAGATLSGTISGAGGLEKLGAYPLTLDGTLENAGDLVASQGTLTLDTEATCRVLINGGRIAGDGAPTWWTVSATAGHQGETSATLSGDDLRVWRARVSASGWHQAVREALEGKVQPGSEEDWFSFSQSNSHGVTGDFDIGTVAELQAKYGTAFSLGEQQGGSYVYADITSQTTELVVFDADADGDYDDFYWVATATTSTEYAPQPVAPNYAADVSPTGVYYANGGLAAAFDDLGIGGINRSYDSASVGNDEGLGYGWQALPRLMQTGNALVVRFGARTEYWFDADATVHDKFNARYGAMETLKHDTANHVFVLALRDGTRYLFHDFSQADPKKPKGRFDCMIAPGGQKLQADYYAGGGFVGKLSSLQRQSRSAVPYEQEVYEYKSAGVNAGRVDKITLQEWDETLAENGDWRDMRRAAYEYYDGASETANGLRGELKTVTLSFKDGDDWISPRTTYLRYATDSGLLKAIVLPEEYATHTGVETATDTVLKAYSSRFYAYSGGKVSEAWIGGLYHYTYTYGTGTGQDGYNTWKAKTEETTHKADASDYSKLTVYTNYLGQLLLTDLSDLQSSHWYALREYGDDGYNDGLLVKEAMPSALQWDSQTQWVAGTGSGLVYGYLYPSTTTAVGDTAGNVIGYRQADQVLNGLSGTPITVSAYTYKIHTAGTGASAVTVRPMASTTVYPTAGQSGVTITYDCTWHTDSAQPLTVTTTLPIVDENQNGPSEGIHWTRAEAFDESGNLIWEKDERGRLAYHAYDPVTGVLTKTIRDFSGTTLPSGCSVNPPGDPPTSGINATTDFASDLMGRTIEVLGPEFVNDNGDTVRTALWMSYLDASREARSASGYATVDANHEITAHTMVNPISVSKLDRDGRLWQSVEVPVDAASEISGTLSDWDGTVLVPEYGSPTYTYSRWTVDYYNAAGQVEAEQVYTKVAPPTSSWTTFGYDPVGRLNRVEDPSDNITRTLHDVRGLVTAVWLGTDDTGYSDADPSNGGANKMRPVALYTYDGGLAGRDGNLTEARLPVDGTSGNDRVTKYGVDWRDRTLWTMVNDGNYQTYTYNTLDNFGRVTETRRFHDANASGLNPVDAEPQTGDVLIAKNTISYDNLNRVYQTAVYAVASDGTLGDALVSKVWYDPSGNVIKSRPGGTQEFTKWGYDGLNRATVQYVGYDTDESDWTAAGNVTGDTVLQQTNTTFDAASNAVFATICQRYHDDTSTPGALSPSTSRASYVGYWQDGAGRATATANYGTRDPGTRPDEAPDQTNLDGDLVTTVIFNERGEVWRTTDAAGHETRQFTDDAGRVTKVIQNYADGSVLTGNADQDITTEYAFNERTLMSEKTVTTVSGSQATHYVYGTDVGNASPVVYRHDLLRAVIYADSTNGLNAQGTDFVTGDSGVYNRVEYTYNRQGDVTDMQDQNQTVHHYELDGLGRRTADSVTSYVTGKIDPSVRRIQRHYDVRGQLQAVTSYSDPSGGAANIVNQVSRDYNSFGQLETEYQEHAGAVNTNYTVNVGYAYADASLGSRLESLVYPNGRTLNYAYGRMQDSTHGGNPYGDLSDPDGNLNRLGAIQESDGTTLAAYSYLGLGTIVTEDFAQPRIKLDYTGTSSGSYPGLDRYNRVIDQFWGKYGTGAEALDDFAYLYDLAGNRTYKQLLTPEADGKGLDELYSYDEVNRLKGVERGTLDQDQGGNWIINSGTLAQQWGVDGFGNWGTFKEGETTGNWDFEQERAVNDVNQIDTIDNGSSDPWAEPDYDLAGNMLAMPKPGEEGVELATTFDAWNRLTTVADASGELARYVYDGLGRKIERIVGGETVTAVTHFYNSGQQMIETREATALPNRTTSTALPEDLHPNYQYVWSARYVDAPVLRDTYYFDETEEEWLIASDQRIYYQTDANMNATALVGVVGSDWEVVERYVYTPYGGATICDADFAPLTVQESAFGNTVRFAGMDVDPDTGLYYDRTRWYNTSLGQFISTDLLPAANLYAYAAVNPVNFTDPSGMYPTHIWDPVLGRVRRFTVEDARQLAISIGMRQALLRGRHQEGILEAAWNGLVSAYSAPEDFYVPPEVAEKGAWEVFSYTFEETRVQPLGDRWYNVAKNYGYSDAEIGDEDSACLGWVASGDILAVNQAAEALEGRDFGTPDQRPLTDIELAQKGLTVLATGAGLTAMGTGMVANASPTLAAKMYPPAATQGLKQGSEYTVADPEKAAAVNDALQDFYQQHCENPSIEYTKLSDCNGVIDPKTGAIKLDESLLGPYQHLHQGALNEELWHFYQFKTQGYLGAPLPPGVNATLENEVIDLILNSGFRSFP